MGQNQPTLSTSPPIFRQYSYSHSTKVSHCQHDIHIYTHKTQPQKHLCLNSSCAVYQSAKARNVNEYYTNRIPLHHPHIISTYHMQFYLRDQAITPAQAEKVLNRTTSNACKTVCSFPSQKEQSSIQVHIVQQYHAHTLQAMIQDRRRQQRAFKEKEIWSIILSCAVAGCQLLSAGFKEPILSPKCIKISQEGQVRVGEWELVHFYQEREEKCQKRKTVANDYYWPPQGIAEIQYAIQLGRMAEDSTTRINNKAQIFSLGMSVLQMCIMKNLYQSQTFSQKTIKRLIQQAMMQREKVQMPLSNNLQQLLQDMLKWDYSQRISYQSLLSKAQRIAITNNDQNRQSIKNIWQDTDQQIHNSQEQSQQSCHEQSTVSQSHTFMVRGGGGEGSGVPSQQNGDCYTPQDQKQTLCKQMFNYQNVEYALPLSPTFISHRSFRNLTTLLREEEDTPNAMMSPINTKQIQHSDDYVEYETNKSKLVEDTKSCDVLNAVEAKTNREKNILSDSIKGQKFSFDQSFDLRRKENNHSNKNSSTVQKGVKQIYILKQSLKQSEIKPMKQVLRQKQLNQEWLFTDPKLLAVLRQSRPKSQISVDEFNQQQSSYVKEQFSKGYYEGSKVNEMRHGYGIFYYKEGGKYCGDWVWDKMHGEGTLYYADGRIAYQGQWRNDTLSGQGVLYNEHPKHLATTYDYTSFHHVEDYWVYYKGEFYQDDKFGHGVLLLSNGEKYEGEFKHDYVHGDGIYHCIDGNKVKGKWHRNIIVQQL